MSHTYAQLCIADFKSRDYDPREPSREELDSDERRMGVCQCCGFRRDLYYYKTMCVPCAEEVSELP